MSIIEIEKSEQSAEPIELFAIKISGLTLRLTSYNEPVLFEGETYQPEQIKRNELVHDTNSFDDRVKISLPLRSTTSRHILNSELESTTEIVIMRTFKGGREKFILWTGVIVQKDMAGEKLNLVCLPTNYILEKIGNRAVYTRVCSHLLYSINCGVDKNAFSTSNHIHSAISSVVKLVQPIDKSFKGGIIQLDNGTSRLILDVDVDQNTITLINPFIGGVDGKDVVLFKGCDKSIKTCQTVFNNFDNYGGFPFIPVRNIFTGSAN